jgi:hypothetical protein
MSKQRPSDPQAAPRRSPRESSDSSPEAEQPPLVIREEDFLAALESSDVQQTLARARDARDAGAFKPQKPSRGQSQA